jgi:hypothetical protein
MKMSRKKMKLLGAFLSVLMLLIAVPQRSLFATMVETEVVLTEDAERDSRTAIKHLIAREDVRNALKAKGIEPTEANRRVDCLSNEEIARIATQIEDLQAGGSFLGVVVGIAVIIFIVFMITDYTGRTDVFPWI